MSSGHMRRRGTVFLLVESREASLVPDAVIVSGHWDGHPDRAAEHVIEELPHGLTLETALEWGRQRSDRVLVRNDDPSVDLPIGRYLWAGSGERPPGVQRLP